MLYWSNMRAHLVVSSEPLHTHHEVCASGKGTSPSPGNMHGTELYIEQSEDPGSHVTDERRRCKRLLSRDMRQAGEVSAIDRSLQGH